MNQLASVKASRSAAIAPCVVDKPDMFAAVYHGQHRSMVTSMLMDMTDPEGI